MLNVDGDADAAVEARVLRDGISLVGVIFRETSRKIAKMLRYFP